MDSGREHEQPQSGESLLHFLVALYPSSAFSKMETGPHWPTRVTLKVEVASNEPTFIRTSKEVPAKVSLIVIFSDFCTFTLASTRSAMLTTLAPLQYIELADRSAAGKRINDRGSPCQAIYLVAVVDLSVDDQQASKQASKNSETRKTHLARISDRCDLPVPHVYIPAAGRR